jgi:hypothetical protein
MCSEKEEDEEDEEEEVVLGDVDAGKEDMGGNDVFGDDVDEDDGSAEEGDEGGGEGGVGEVCVRLKCFCACDQYSSSPGRVAVCIKPFERMMFSCSKRPMNACSRTGCRGATA